MNLGNISNNEIIIEAEGLTKKFGEFTAVDNISFSVKKGEIFALLGPNGAGKTTTIKMLTTLLRPTAGKAKLNGYDVLHEQSKARESFGIVFQDPSVDDDLTAYENMMFHAALYKVPEPEEKIISLLEFVELGQRKDSLVKTFSGGMKRRLEIARGLLHTPKVLFLDEPTLGLDPQTRLNIWNRLKELSKQGMTVFFTTHYMDEVENFADSLAIVDKGKIIKSGTPAQLKKETKKQSLEQAFLTFTGHGIRDEESNGLENLRLHRRMRRA